MADGFRSDDKIILRGFRRDDLEPYRRWIDNPAVTHYMEMGWKPCADSDLERTFVEATQAHDTVCFVIEERETGRPLGTCGLYLINWTARRSQYRILLGEPDAFNKGIGTAATRLVVAYGFERVNLETIYLGANAENKGAIRAYEKAGFVHDGVHRKFIYNNGVYYDAVAMSILREEYFAAKDEKA